MQPIRYETLASCFIPIFPISSRWPQGEGSFLLQSRSVCRKCSDKSLGLKLQLFIVLGIEKERDMKSMPHIQNILCLAFCNAPRLAVSHLS